MNEKDINVLLDHFVGALDSTESASVTHKINTIPLWSKTYKQINLVFGSLNSIKEEDSKQSAPEGLANKTFQKILELKKSQQSSPDFIAQKPAPSEPISRSTDRKRPVSIKPSVLALSACAGFLFVVALTFSTSFLGVSDPDSTSNPGKVFVAGKTSSNNSTDFAITGSSQQPSSSMFFCSDSTSSTPIPFSNEVANLAINSSEQLVDLSGSSVYPAAERRENPVKMACPDGFVVLSSQPEGRPIILVQPFPDELKKIQNVVNQQNVNFVAPVNYQK